MSPVDEMRFPYASSAVHHGICLKLTARRIVMAGNQWTSEVAGLFILICK